jgi:hypothetical protein
MICIRQRLTQRRPVRMLRECAEIQKSVKVFFIVYSPKPHLAATHTYGQVSWHLFIMQSASQEVQAEIIIHMGGDMREQKMRKPSFLYATNCMFKRTTETECKIMKMDWTS